MKEFDFKRAIQIVLECTEIFGRDWLTIEPIDDYYLRIGYKNIYLDFSCYKYC